MTYDTAVSTEPRACPSRTHPFHLQLRAETPDLRRHAMRLTRNWHRAQDLVQETLTKAWASRALYAGHQSARLAAHHHAQHLPQRCAQALARG